MQISRMLAVTKVRDAPDVVPEVLDVLLALPDAIWDGCEDLSELVGRAAPWLESAGCDADELTQVLGRHVGTEWAEVQR